MCRLFRSYLVACAAPVRVEQTSLSDLIQSKSTADFFIKKDNFEPKNLSADIFPEQIREVSELNGLLFALVLQQSSGVWIHRDGKALPITWTGILTSRDGGQSWERFVKIVNPDAGGYSDMKGEIPYNPIGIFAKDGKLYADFQNYSGAGSGEGMAVRFVTVDGGVSWKPETCFYVIPEAYDPKKPVEIISYTKAFNVESPLKLEKCNFPMPLLESVLGIE